MKISPKELSGMTGKASADDRLAAVLTVLADQKAAQVTVAAPAVNVTSPAVNVTVPKPERCSWRFDITRDSDGLIKSITANPV
jgi:anti-sigma factor ChrR (cupin superfamily)